MNARSVSEGRGYRSGTAIPPSLVSEMELVSRRAGWRRIGSWQQTVSVFGPFRWVLGPKEAPDPRLGLRSEGAVRRAGSAQAIGWPPTCRYRPAGALPRGGAEKRRGL